MKITYGAYEGELSRAELERFKTMDTYDSGEQTYAVDASHDGVLDSEHGEIDPSVQDELMAILMGKEKEPEASSKNTLNNEQSHTMHRFSNYPFYNYDYYGHYAYRFVKAANHNNGDVEVQRAQPQDLYEQSGLSAYHDVNIAECRDGNVEVQRAQLQDSGQGHTIHRFSNYPFYNYDYYGHYAYRFVKVADHNNGDVEVQRAQPQDSGQGHTIHRSYNYETWGGEPAYRFVKIGDSRDGDVGGPARAEPQDSAKQ